MKKILLSLILLLPLFLFAKVETTYLTVEGVGKTRAEAIRNGLIEAVKQTQGVAISSKRSYIKSIGEVGIMVDGDSTHAVSISEQSVKSINEATRGFIKKYSIVDSYQEGNNWIVKLQIAMKRYKSPGFNPNKRRKIAVIPFEYKDSYIILGAREKGREVSKRFTQALITKITQSRKFTVLDRENSIYYQSEKNFILSGNSGKDELLKLGKRLGTDYLLIGQILDYSIKKVTETNNIGIPETSRLVCNATISYRILMMATQQIKWSETLSKSFNLEENRDINSAEAIVAIASDKISSYILENILNNIYPPRIVAVTANNIIVNQGGNSIREGEIFKVFAKGERLVDPYTKEYLGYEEIEAGKIVIKSVKPKVSYARLLEGRVSKGMILRRIKSENGKAAFHSEGEAETDVKIAPGGGVVLPFD